MEVKEEDGMYSEWNSLPLEGGGRGVLGAVGGRDVVLAVVRQLASHQPSPLTTDAEVINIPCMFYTALNIHVFTPFLLTVLVIQ